MLTGLMLLINNGLILSISRKENPNKFGLIGGKRDSSDLTTMDSAIRETKEETNIIVFDCVFIYSNLEFRQEPHSKILLTSNLVSCYYATDWMGSLKDSDEGHLEWLSQHELTSTKGAFIDFNTKMFVAFKEKFPSVYLKD